MLVPELFTFSLIRYKTICFIIFLFIFSICIPYQVSALDIKPEVYSFEEGIGSGWDRGDLDLSWSIDSNESNTGTSSLKSGPVRCQNEKSTISREVKGPCTIQFWWKKNNLMSVPSRLSFYVDDKEIEICDSTNWTQITHDLDNNYHKITWIFNLSCIGTHCCWYPDYDCSRDRAYGWIDDVEIMPFGTKYVHIEDDLQDIIDSSRGYTLYLQNGTYIGNPTISISDITIKPFSGRPTLDGQNGNYSIALENVENVNIEDLELTNSSDGIRVRSSINCNISGNNIHFLNGSGILLRGCSQVDVNRNSITTLNISNSNNSGIKLVDSNNNSIIDNQIYVRSNNFLIYLDRSIDNIIVNPLCGKIFDNLIKCQCDPISEGDLCYICEEGAVPTFNNWTFDPVRWCSVS